MALFAMSRILRFDRATRRSNSMSPKTRKRIFSAFLLLSIMGAPFVASAQYYLSPTGSDKNDGLSPSTPFLTLPFAQSAMRKTSIKTVYLTGGLYSLTQAGTASKGPYAINMLPADNGESWLAYQDATPVLDGGGTLLNGIYVGFYDAVGTRNITIRGLTLQNMVNGIQTMSCSNLTIDGNTFLNIVSKTTNNASINIFWGTTDSEISNNYINGNTGPGIRIATGGVKAPDLNTNIHLDNNQIYNTNTLKADCGAIYIWEPSHLAANTGITVNNNIIGNFGGSPKGVGIYLDDEASNVSVTNNIVYGKGQYCALIHGGDHNVFENNIFDVGTYGGKIGLYQDDQGAHYTNYGMKGNVFAHNIVYSSQTSFGKYIWDLIDQSTTGITFPSVSNNLYYDPNVSKLPCGSATPTSGPSHGLSFTDSSSVYANPLFVNAAANNYNFQSGSPAFTDIAFKQIFSGQHFR